MTPVTTKIGHIMFNNIASILKSNKDEIAHRAIVIGGATAGMVIASGLSAKLGNKTKDDVVIEETVEVIEVEEEPDVDIVEETESE